MMKAVFAEQGACVVKTVHIPEPDAGQVLIKVDACGVNRADCMQRAGQYPPPPGSPEILGLEVVGHVHSVGTGVSRAIGSRVMCIVAGGGYAEYVAAYDSTLIKCPESWTANGNGPPTAAQLCAIPETYMTAYQLLIHVGKAQAGDVVLIHAGASNVGLAAIQLAAKLIGALPIVTCSETKMASARQVGAIAVVDRKANDGEWAAKVKIAANEARMKAGLPVRDGVDLVLDPVGGNYAEQNCEVLSVDGRWVLYGLMGGSVPNGAIFGHILRKRIQLLGTTIRARSAEYKAAIAKQIETEVIPLLAQNVLRAPVHAVIPLIHAEEALNLMLKDESVGKIVLTLEAAPTSDAKL